MRKNREKLNSESRNLSNPIRHTPQATFHKRGNFKI